MITKLLLIILLFVAVEVILGAIFICAMQKKIDSGDISEQNLEIGNMEQKMSPCSIKNRYYEFCMDTFLRKTYPDLVRWECLYAKDVYSNFNGRHHIIAYFEDGKKKKLQVIVKFSDPIANIEIEAGPSKKEEPVPEEPKSTPTPPEPVKEEPSSEELDVLQKAEKWWKGHCGKIMQALMEKESCLIPKEELPTDRDVLDMMVSRLNEEMGYSTYFNEVGLCVLIE